MRSRSHSRQATARVAIVLSNANINRMAAGIQSHALGQRDFWVIDFYRPIDEIKRFLRDWKPLGVITQWDPDVTPSLIDLGFPTVLIAADVQVPGVGSVDVDDEAVGLEAARHLIATGLSHFGYLGNGTHYSAQRLTGYRDGLRASGYTCAAIDHRPRVKRQPIEYWHESDAQVQRWLKGLPKPVGVFAAHDPTGRFLAESCRYAGLQIPEEVAIVSADDDELVCGLTHPPLSSIRIPWKRVGFDSARVMEEMLQTGRAPAAAVLVSPGSTTPRLSSDLLAVAQPNLQAAMRIIRDRACDGLSVKELLDHLTVSRRSLEQEFRKHLNRTPRDEIVRVRMQAARNLLARTHLSMPLVAERCGFANAERFSVVFRQIEGMPPSHYREQFRLDPSPVSHQHG